MDVIGFEDRYEVTEDGKVISKERKAKNQFSARQEVKQTFKKTGYLEVRLYDGKKTKAYLVHRLIAQHFIPNPENKRTVNHIDGNKLNNSVSNLEWATDSENQKHSLANGLSKVDLEQISKMNKSRRLFTDEEVACIRVEHSTTEISLRALAKKYNVSYSTLRDIITRKNYVS